MSELIKPTGQVVGHWTEYEETYPGFSVGYFWRRTDGLRMGVRGPGNYPKNGVSNQEISDRKRKAPRGIDLLDKLEMSGQEFHDTRGIIPNLSDGVSEDMEWLPEHVRFHDKDGKELECLLSIDGIPANQIQTTEVVFKYAEKKWPIKFIHGKTPKNKKKRS